MSKPNALQVYPGRCLGFLALGAALQEVLSILKSRPQMYPSLDLSYSPSNPLQTPVVIDLPKNGLRLRFDGPTQRLRLIEVLDFSFTSFTYEGRDVVKLSPDGAKVNGPVFRHIYDRLIGPTFPGEYVPPAEGTGSRKGLYILSYPGIAFTFPIQHSAWSKSRDFVSLLSSQYAEPAKSMAIFDGDSWREARKDLFDRPSLLPRPYVPGSRTKDFRPDEIDQVLVTGDGQLEILRHGNSPPFRLVLNSCTAQDLLVELGPPDAIYRKSDRRLSIHKSHRKSRSSSSNTHMDDPGADTGYSSHAVTTDESDVGDNNNDTPIRRQGSKAKTECFWNYFRHGIDIFLSLPQPKPHRLNFGTTAPDKTAPLAVTEPDHLVATKVLLYGNIPGSYPFNRYRRCRWRVGSSGSGLGTRSFTSETKFKRISKTLQKTLDSSPGTKADPQDSGQQGMILNRGWGNSPGSSCELLGGWEEGGDKSSATTTAAATAAGAGETGASMVEDTPGTGNTELFGFPGLIFEVLKNDTVSCLTIY